jgi:hypothetical protein
MDLESYLDGLRACSRSETIITPRYESPIPLVTMEFGIRDNWPILLDAEFSSVVAHLKTYCRIDTEQEEYVTLVHNTRPVLVQAVAGIPFFWMAGTDMDRERQSGYAMGLQLQPWTENLQGSYFQLFPAVADAAVELGDYIVKNRIPACLPKCRPWKDPEENARIIYYP